jgi:microsomal prostaglandin-E synthase 1
MSGTLRDMLLTASNPTFVYYVISVVALSGLLLFLWAYSGAVRGKTKTAMNPEDGGRFNATVVEHDPPAVARVLRAHKNAQANIYPYFAVGLVFVCLGGGATMGAVLFAIFTVARFVHAAVYLAGKQPWRTIAFLFGSIATLVLMVDVVMMLLKHSA